MKRSKYLSWGIINIFSPLIWLWSGLCVGGLLIGICYTCRINEDIISKIVGILTFLLFSICISSCIAGFIVGLKKKQSSCWILSVIGFCLLVLSLFGAYYLGSRY